MTTENDLTHGLILFAHGSRDPQWRAPMESVAARAAALDPQTRVACAYLELMEPDLPACAATLAAEGVHEITIVPMFLGVGRHARPDADHGPQKLCADVRLGDRRTGRPRGAGWC